MLKKNEGSCLLLYKKLISKSTYKILYRKYVQISEKLKQNELRVTY